VRSALPAYAGRRIARVELSEYQRRSRRTAAYPREAWLAYPALGLVGEAGEVAEHVKRVIRDDGATVTDERREAIAAELGDVLWYVAQLATELGLDLGEIARDNLTKLLSRQRRGVLQGAGDDR
jgi:NTP pyrophosphatase (non-canonical NTP hydrolase)